MSEAVSKIVDHGYYAGMFWREHFFYKKGDFHKGHTHEIDHATVIMKGSVLVEVEGKDPFNASAPAILEIPKEVLHKFTALEDNTIYMCIFSTKDYEETLIKDGENKIFTKEELIGQLKNKLCKDCDGCYVEK